MFLSTTISSMWHGWATMTNSNQQIFPLQGLASPVLFCLPHQCSSLSKPGILKVIKMASLLYLGKSHTLALNSGGHPFFPLGFVRPKTCCQLLSFWREPHFPVSAWISTWFPGGRVSEEDPRAVPDLVCHSSHTVFTFEKPSLCSPLLKRFLFSWLGWGV